MAWRGLHLSESAHLKHKDNSLVCVRDDDEIRIPTEDLAFVVVDGRDITLSASLMASLGKSGSAVIFCDEKHLPSGIFLPYGQHYRHSEIADIQKTASPGLSNALWKLIVHRKILNQAENLSRQNVDDMPLRAMAERIKPGDPDNIEARAARDYWSSLFSEFKRGDKTDSRNMALNYGYAIIRSVVARSCVAYGLVTAFGINHASVSNAFNLVDDLMEPFRPMVDSFVCSLEIEVDDERLGKTTRQKLASIPMLEVRMGQTTTGMMPAADLMVESFVRALRNKKPSELILPEFTP